MQHSVPVQLRHRPAARLGMVSTVRLSQVEENTHLRRIPIVPEPCANEECVCPFELQDHRVTHRVLGPCLCAMTDASQPDFVEAAMYVLPVGSRDNTSPAAPRVDAVTSVSHDSVL
jgi:hypothetical protein